MPDLVFYSNFVKMELYAADRSRSIGPLHEKEIVMKTEQTKTALIIGAGPAGLTAAYQLLKETDILPIIIEKENFPGGISRTMEHNGNRIDIGGHRFFSKSGEVTRLWEELMPTQGFPSKDDKAAGRVMQWNQGGPDPETADRVMLLRNRVSRIFYLRKFFDYPVSLSLRTIKNLGLWTTLKAGTGYLYSACFKRKEINLENFMINRFGAPLYRMFFKDYTEKVWGKKPADISPEWGSQRVKGLSLTKALLHALSKPFGKSEKNVETSLIEQFRYPKKGPGQLWETMGAEIIKMGGKILLNTEAAGISIKDGKIVSVSAETDGERRTFQADYYFSTMPVSELIGAMDKEVPEEVRKIARELPYRDFITVGLLVDKLKIKNATKLKTVAGLVPDCWIYVQDKDVRLGRVQIFNNWSPYMVQDFEHTVWIGLEYFCNEGDALWNMGDLEFIAFATGEVEKIGLIDRKSVRDSVRIRVKKAYPAYFGSYQHFDRVKDFLNSVENLYCIGRNGQHRYNNMDHSMLTAMEAVRNIRTGAGSKESLWEVNAASEYHEEK